jgi:hypothetical protein
MGLPAPAWKAWKGIVPCEFESHVFRWSCLTRVYLGEVRL